MNRSFCKLFLFFLLAVSNGYAQDFPFAGEIKAFKKQDSISFPPSHAILFVGSSSFNFWKDVQDYFPGYTIINRGFGGSSLPDVIRYADDIIFPYQPKQIVIYCGENDLTGSNDVTGKQVFTRFKKLFKMIRKKMPNENIVFVSLKPSPSRRNLMPEMVEANQLIEHFISKKKYTSYVDVYNKMLNPDGSPIGEIFKADSLHMNPKGYAIWQKAIEPYLVK